MQAQVEESQHRLVDLLWVGRHARLGSARRDWLVNAGRKRRAASGGARLSCPTLSKRQFQRSQSATAHLRTFTQPLAIPRASNLAPRYRIAPIARPSAIETNARTCMIYAATGTTSISLNWEIRPLADIATCWHPDEDDGSCTPKTSSPAAARLLSR